MDEKDQSKELNSKHNLTVVIVYQFSSSVTFSVVIYKTNPEILFLMNLEINFMKQLFFLLFIFTSLIYSCSSETTENVLSPEGPTEKVLFEDMKKHINESSNQTVELVKVEITQSNYEKAFKDEVYKFQFTGTFKVQEDCYLDWNTSGGSEIPSFSPILEKPDPSLGLTMKFFEKGKSYTYKGFTTYLKKEGKWKVLSM